MRPVRRPPKFDTDKLARLIGYMSKSQVREYVAETNSEYYHWDKLRHRPTPEGLTPEDAWTLIKLSRMGPRRTLPLRDEADRPFSYWLPDPAVEILHEVDRWGGTTLAVAADAAAALGSMRDRIVVSSLMEEAIATSQIEGAVTTRKVAKEMLRTNRNPRNRSEQMILNSYRTIQMLRQRLEEPLTQDLLFEIQENMARGTLDNPTGAGRFRTPGEEINVIDVRDSEVVYVPPRAEHLQERIQRLLAFANAPQQKGSFIHPLVKAAVLHFWLAYEHPFVDGNGRTARALFYWYMLKSGYWLFEYLTISRIIVAAPMQYYRSFLYSEHDDNDLTYSLVYQLRATQRALSALRQYLAEKQEEQRVIAVGLRRFPDLNHRQRALLDHALRNPAQVYTFVSHQNTHGISRVTARNDLIDLAEQGLLVEARQGKQRAFLAVEDLAKRLSSGAGRPKGRTGQGQNG
jgi:Fic family protein